MANPPLIFPLQEERSPRPFWSVMIPTYNPQPHYLEETLRGILLQDPGPEQMQIEVVDDGSANNTASEVVYRIGAGRVAFHARVAVNALRIVERQLTLGPGHEQLHAAGLAELGCADDAELTARIRAGELDGDAAHVRHVVARSVRAKLEVSNPSWLVPD